MSSNPRFHWDDPLLLDQQLTDDERMVRDAAAAYCQDKLQPRVLEAFRHERTDTVDLPRDGRTRPARPDHSRAVRRPRPELRRYGLIAREVERVDSGYRSMMSVQSSLVMVPIYEFGTEAQQAEIPAEAGHRRMDRLLRPDRAEPRLRSGLDGHARQESRRRLCADRHARCGSPIRRSPTCSWSGPRTTKARSAASCWKKAGRACPRRRSTASSACAPRSPARSCMDDVFCPEENAFPDVRGLKGPFTCLNSARYGIAWGALGAAEDCWHTRAPVRAGPQAVRPAAGRQPADPEEAGRHADRDHARACRAACGWAA